MRLETTSTERSESRSSRCGRRTPAGDEEEAGHAVAADKEEVGHAAADEEVLIFQRRTQRLRMGPPSGAKGVMKSLENEFSPRRRHHSKPNGGERIIAYPSLEISMLEGGRSALLAAEDELLPARRRR